MKDTRPTGSLLGECSFCVLVFLLVAGLPIASSLFLLLF